MSHFGPSLSHLGPILGASGTVPHGFHPPSGKARAGVPDHSQGSLDATRTPRRAHLLVCLLLACGGGDSNEPDDPFPDASGVFEIEGTFDDLPASSISFTGTLELTQASQQSGALQGSIAILADLSGDVFNVNDESLSGASVSPSGVITFSATGGTSSWTFTGTLSGDRINGGRHTLSGDENFSGPWSGQKAQGVPSLPNRARWRSRSINCASGFTPNASSVDTGEPSGLSGVHSTNHNLNQLVG